MKAPRRSRGGGRAAENTPPLPGIFPSPEQLRRADLERAPEYPFPLLDISRRRALMWVCKAPPPGHDPCRCWPEGYPTIEDAIQDLTLEQLGVKR